MKSNRYCIICGKRDFRLIKSIGAYKIYECKTCELAYTDSSKVPMKERREQTNIQYSLPEYKKELKKHTKKFIKILKIIKKFKKTGKLLDVGGGFGLFSKVAKENSKFHVEIIEPNLETYFINKNNIKSHRVKLENFCQNTKRRYDVIVLLDVLEHFENPDKIIEDLKRILKDKGLIVLSLPNYKSIMAYLSKSWAWWMVEDHKYHFSANSISLLMKKHKLKKKYLTTYNSVIDLKKNLDGNFVHLPFPVNKLVKIFILFPFLLIYIIFRPIFWSFELGALSIGVFKKNAKK